MHPTTGDGGESLTVHQQLQRLAPEYRARFGGAMPGRQRQVLHKILRCRTPALGGELFKCPDCPGFHYRYHSGENALRYLSRYIFKTATSNRKVSELADGRLRWGYRDSNTQRLTSIRLEPMEFMRRFLQHTLPCGFTRVRTFGWLHPAAKVRLNRVRALLRQAPLLTPAQQETWNPPSDPDLESPPPEVKPARTVLCPHCQKVMRRIGSWHPGRMLLYPQRPP